MTSDSQQRSIKSEIWASPVNTCGTVCGNGDEQPASRSYVQESRNSTPFGFELGTLMASTRSNEDAVSYTHLTLPTIYSV